MALSGGRLRASFSSLIIGIWAAAAVRTEPEILQETAFSSLIIGIWAAAL